MRLSSADGERSKVIVRGDRCCGYHNDVLLATKSEVSVLPDAPQLRLEQLGGGRIMHHPATGKVKVYGYSMAFGPAVHEVAAALIRQTYPWYAPDGVSVDYEGY